MGGSRADISSNRTSPIGRRGASRLRLALPARLVTTSASVPCILQDLSRTGARVHLAKPLCVGEACFLQFFDTEVFVEVVRRLRGTNGPEFDCPLSDEDVIQVRANAENIEAVERRSVRSDARDWVSGSR